MICHPCRDRLHDQCPGGTWCDCQHRPGTALPADPDGDDREETP